MKRLLNIKVVSLLLLAVVGLLATLVIAINLWIPKQPIVNYINSVTGGQASLEKVVVGWDWGPDIRIDDLTISGIQLGDSQVDVDLAQTRLKASFKAFWKNLTGTEDEAQPNAQNENAASFSGSARNQLIQYFHSLKVVDGSIVVNNEAKQTNINAELFEFKAEDADSTIIVFKGNVDGVDLALAGALSGLHSLIAENSSDVEITGYILNESTPVLAEGVVGNIRNMGDISLSVAVEVEDPSSVAGQFGGPQIDLSMLSKSTIQFDLSMLENPDSLTISSLDARSAAFGVDFRLYSNPGRHIAFDDIDLNLEATGTLADLPPTSLSALEGDVQVRVLGRIAGSADQMSFMPSEAVLEATGIHAKIEGNFQFISGTPNMYGTLEAEIAQDAPFVTPTIEFLFPAVFQSKFQMHADGLNFSEIRLRSNQEIVEHARVEANGGLSASGSGIDGNFDITGFFNQQGLQQFGRIRLPEQLEIEAATTLNINQSQFTLDQINLTGRLPGVELVGTGNYALSEGLESMTMQIEGVADSAKSLGDVFKKNWPDTAQVTASTILKQDASSNWILDDFRLEMHEDDLKIKAIGDMRLFHVGDIGNFTVTASADRPQFMERISRSAILHSLIEPIVPLEATAKLYLRRKDKSPISFDLREIEINSQVAEGLASATGEVVNIQSAKRKGALAIRIRDNQGRYSALLDAGRVEQHPILSESMETDLRLVVDGTGMHVDDLSILLLADDARIQANGSFETLNPMITRDLKIDFAVQQLSQLNRFSGSSRFQDIPAEGQLLFANNAAGIVDVKMQAKIKDQSINGVFKVDFSPSGKHDVDGYVQINELDLEKIIEQEEKQGPLFSDHQLNLAWLDSINLDLELDIGKFQNQTFNLEEVSGDIKIQDGALRLEMVGHADNKPLDMWLKLRPSQSGWDAALGMFGENVDVDVFDHNFRGAENLDSVISIDIDLTAQGRSMSEMASSANGHVNVEVKDVGVKVGESFVYGDLIFSIFNLVFFQQSQDDYDLMECGVARFRVSDGVAFIDNSLALKLKDFSILGSGRIDLVSEELDIVLSSKARKGLGISLNTIAKLFKVGGTLRNPELVPDAEGLAKTGTSLLAGLLTSGLSVFAQGYFDKEAANDDICESARTSSASR